MTAVKCKEAGLEFAAVHDSYWTHAGTVEDMSHLLREAFVELYENPILEDLDQALKFQNPDIDDFPTLPERGDWKLESVLDSRYFFS